MRLFITVFLLLASVCNAEDIHYSSKRVVLKADFDYEYLHALRQSFPYSKENKNMLMTAGEVASAIKRATPGPATIYQFEGHKTGISYTGEKKDFPYILLLKAGADGVILDGYAVMPLWAELPIFGVAARVRVENLKIAREIKLAKECFEPFLGKEKLVVDYSGTLIFPNETGRQSMPAQTEAAETPEQELARLNREMNAAMSQYEMNIASGQLARYWERMLQKEEAEILASCEDVTAATIFKKTQKAWREFRVLPTFSWVKQWQEKRTFAAREFWGLQRKQ